MSYRTFNGIDISIMKYLAGNDKHASAEKNKQYYIASANKTMTRLELARARIRNAFLSEKDNKFLIDKILYGLNWLDMLKNNIKDAKDDIEFSKAVSYTEWHAVKLIPSAAEGYAISLIMKDKLNDRNNTSHAKLLEDAKYHNHKAKIIFTELLNLKENSNFKLAEKQRIKAYKELISVNEILKRL